MEYTEYKMDLKRIHAKVRTMKRMLRARRGTTDLVGFGLTVIRERLLEDPACYLTYGPYWWTMKDMLIRRGYKFGAELDEEVLEHYRGGNDEEWLVMCEVFRDIYFEKFMRGARRFSLDGASDEDYVLVDHDMENRILPDIALI